MMALDLDGTLLNPGKSISPQPVFPATTDNADAEIKEIVAKKGGIISKLPNSDGVGEVLQRIL